MPHTTNLKGEQGGVILGDTTATYTATDDKSNLVGFLVLEDAVLSAVTMPDVSDSADLVGPTFLAGSFIPFTITTITVSSGLIAGLFGVKQ